MIAINGWYIVAVNKWYIVAVNHWYIIGCKVTTGTAHTTTSAATHTPAQTGGEIVIQRVTYSLAGQATEIGRAHV